MFTINSKFNILTSVETKDLEVLWDSKLIFANTTSK